MRRVSEVIRNKDSVLPVRSLCMSCLHAAVQQLFQSLLLRLHHHRVKPHLSFPAPPTLHLYLHTSFNTSTLSVLIILVSSCSLWFLFLLITIKWLFLTTRSICFFTVTLTAMTESSAVAALHDEMDVKTDWSDG